MAASLLSLLTVCMVGQSADLLPDVTIWSDQLLDNSIDQTTIPGRTLLRLSTGTPNIGVGRLELRGGTINPDGTQNVNQRIYRADGSFWERLAGEFTYHPSHGHIHFDNWCKYRLRAKNPDGSVGAILAEGQKTSFCILDLRSYDSTNPGYHAPGYYSGCGSTVQGLTPGWADIYSKGLTDQWVDVTGIPDGDYYLEAEVDPSNDILESDETNNIGRVQVHLGVPPPPTADAYEENDSKAQVDARTEGPNSPQLGTVNVLRNIAGLTITPGDPDWFRFRLNSTGGAGDYVKITSQYSGGDIDLKLYNSAGTQLAVSQSTTNNETISLSGRPAGYYYIHVYPFSGSNPGYTLSIQPSGNQPPSITITSPATAMWIERSYETVPVHWTATDPNNDPTRVSLFISRQNTFNKSAMAVPGYQDLPGADSFANMNTAEMATGQYFMYLKVTDGGAQVIQRAPGAFMLYIRGDMDWDGHLTQADLDLLSAWIIDGKDEQKFWRRIGDMDRDGDVDAEDVEILEHIVTGGRP